MLNKTQSSNFFKDFRTAEWKQKLLLCIEDP